LLSHPSEIYPQSVIPHQETIADRSAFACRVSYWSFALPRLGNGPLKFLLQLLHTHLRAMIRLWCTAVLQLTQSSLSLRLI